MGISDSAGDSPQATICMLKCVDYQECPRDAQAVSAVELIHVIKHLEIVEIVPAATEMVI